MRCIQRLAQLHRNRKGFLGLQLAQPLESLRESFSADQLHGQKNDLNMILTVIPEVEYPAHIGVGYLARQLDFAPQAVNDGRANRCMLADDFKSDLLIELKVFSFIDLAHATAPKMCSDAITASQRLSRLENALISANL